MKTNIIVATAVAALFSATAAHAQLGVKKLTGKIVPKVTVGVKLGANLQQTTGDAILEQTYKAGILGGAFVSVAKGKMGVRVEGLIKTARITYSATSYDVKFVYLDVPVLFEYKVIPRLKLHAGPQFTSMLSARSSGGSDIKSAFNTADVAVAAGAEVNLPVHLTVGARYIKGFVDINNNPAFTGSWKNSSIQISVGYRFLN